MKRWITIALLMLMCIFFSGVAHAATASNDVVKRAIELLTYFETRGDYGCAENDTNGHPSFGIIQWNGERAVYMVNRIIEKDRAGAQNILGSALFKKLDGVTKSPGVMTKDELSRVSKLLKTDAGIPVQDALAKSDVAMYVEQAMNLGITDKNALAYFGDMRHQVGSGAIKKYHVLAAEKAGGYEKVKLKHLYQAALNYATRTKARREKAYQMLIDNPVSGSTNPANPNAPVKPSAVSLGAKSQTLYLGHNLTLSPAFLPENAQAACQWQSSNKRIATVSGGIVTPKKTGKVTIRVKTENGKLATVRVTVKPVPVTSIALSGAAQMQVGAIQTLNVAILPADATKKKVQFKSSNPKIAKVSKTGKILAKKAGTVTIHAKAAGGKKVLAQFKIMVTK